ncbi:GNAT family N-acetyltransferase [Solirubrobacter ginsenosidimutans]|uniref:GNAT family N-acetyltransferase n=1 Tax=Solirubrobacter ginsenosidimutans TaxID=490573 RepID=A0A9X3MZ99_9ACTN|nr:GNAT family N-acetyltransferase [Solirubrobacter ginsenosidimutans]MDA0164015.1 GNAT family N-acetyltransferase [Solirubrobacter ginsenosidimutans]
MSVEIVVPETTEELDQVRALIRTFVAWHRARHETDRDLIDRYFDAAEFERELAGLPGKYGPPGGQLLLAKRDGEAAGCVALRALAPGICEMKRMYVDERFRGQGVGAALSERVLAEARTLGYRAMQLDTSIRQAKALGLYRRMGFTEIEPYYDVADELRGWLVFMQLELN